MSGWKLINLNKQCIYINMHRQEYHNYSDYNNPN